MKAWYKSKIVWLGILQSLIGALDVIIKFLQSGQPINEVSIMLIVSGILAVILRIWFTDTPVG